MPKSKPYLNGKNAAPQAGDETVGAWPRERLMAVDQRFRERVERAFAAGKESRRAAASKDEIEAEPGEWDCD